MTDVQPAGTGSQLRTGFTPGRRGQEEKTMTDNFRFTEEVCDGASFVP